MQMGRRSWILDLFLILFHILFHSFNNNKTQIFHPDLLCPELASLLQEAVEMKWPFAPEKWQYKQALSASDKTNLNDLIAEHISPLLVKEKAAVTWRSAGCVNVYLQVKVLCVARLL